MALDFPNSPTIGDEFTGGGFTWVWTGTTWSKVVAATGVTGDFALLVGSTGNTTYVLDRTYSAGLYAIDFANNDTTYDIYFVAENGTAAGYSNSSVIQATADFSEVVVLGATNNETILFNFQGSTTAPSTAGDVAVAGAYVTSVVTSSLPNIDDSTVVNGGNFASDVTVGFIGQNAVETAAKAVVRSSSTQLIVTRPDAFSPAQSPYTVKVVNPGIPVPSGSNGHLLSNAVTAGTNPSWVTGANVFYNISGATSITLLATDTEGSDIDYSIVSGSLPAGLSLDNETGVVSGTFSGSASEGDVTSVTIRATDAGGNFLDRAFSFTANASPVWTTPAGAITNSIPGSSYSFQLVASTGSAGGALTYSLQSGSLLAGLTLSSSGLISGTNSTSTGTTASFTIRVTDAGGAFSDRSFTLLSQAPFISGGTKTTSGSYTVHTFNSSDTLSYELSSTANVSVEYVVIAGGGGGGNSTTGDAGGGGGGAGGYRSSVPGEFSGGGSSAMTPLTFTGTGSLSVLIGAGGTGSTMPSQNGNTSSIGALVTSSGGGYGGSSSGFSTGGTGGSGGGGYFASSAGSGSSGQGYAGGPGNPSGPPYNGGCGGGAGSAGTQGSPGAGLTSSITGSAVARAGGGGRGGNHYGASPVNGTAGGGNGASSGAVGSPGTANTGGGGGGGWGGPPNFTAGGQGGSGVVIIRYLTASVA